MATEADARGVLPERSRAFLERVASAMAGLPAVEVAGHVEALVDRHERWRTHECLNLLGAENVLGRRARRLLDSDLATRVTEGFPGAKDVGGTRLNHVIDEIEAVVVGLCRRLFGCAYVDWRPLSNSMANAVALASTATSGDTICVQPMAGGGNLSYQAIGVAGHQGLEVADLPQAPEFGIDPDRLAEVVRARRPRVLVVGGSRVLFPYPLRRMRALADEVGAAILYDAAHLAPLVAAGEFQDPLGEGADVLTTSTHKFLGGPVGGLVMTNDPGIARRVFAATHPGFLQTRDQNKTAALAFSLAETLEFGADYARATVANARALAAELAALDFEVMGAERGFTATHQLFVHASRVGPRVVEERCQRANILVKTTPATHGEGQAVRDVVRLTTQELTRRGLGPGEMREVACLIARAVTGADPETLRADVAALVARFPGVAYTFDA